MNFKMMGRFLAQILSIEGIFMIPALLISLFCGDTMAVQGFAWSIAAIAAVAGILALSSRGAPSAFTDKALFGIESAGLSSFLSLPGDPQLRGCFL